MAPAHTKLFTPGPLCTSPRIKNPMNRDVGARDTEFIYTVQFIRSELLSIAEADLNEWTTVLLQGSGTYVIEAVFQTTTKRDGSSKALILSNGAYGERMIAICKAMGLDYDYLSTPEDESLPISEVEAKLKKGKYSIVAVVHLETSSGVINDLEEITKLIRKWQPQAYVLADAMSSFGMIPIKLTNIDFLVSSPNKCLEGVPGVAFVLCKRDILIGCKGNSRSLCLDLVAQYEGLEENGQFRFTPPTHVILALKEALCEFRDEEGIHGRSKRYVKNCEILRKGMKDLGFKELVPSEHAGHVITSFMYPSDPKFEFSRFYELLANKDQVIYPGKMTKAECFRIGNIGDIYTTEIKHLLRVIEVVLKEMEIKIPVA